MTRKDRNESSYRRALKIALVASVVAHGAVLAFGRLTVSGFTDAGEEPSLVFIDLVELPADKPLEVVALSEAAEGEESAEVPSSAPISEAVDSESSEPTGVKVEPSEAESAAPRVVFTNPESERSSTVFLTTVSTDRTGPTLATDATIEDLLIKPAPETQDGAGVDDEYEQWASARTSRSGGGRGIGIGIGIGGGGYGGGDSCKPGGRIISTRAPLSTGRFQPRF